MPSIRRTITIFGGGQPGPFVPPDPDPDPVPTLTPLVGMSFVDPLNRPIEPSFQLGAGPETGDVLVFEYADNFAMDDTSRIEVTITDEAQETEEDLVAALNDIPAGIIFATAWYRRGAEVSPKLPIIAHGATVAPVTTAPASVTVAERQPLAVAVSSDQPGILSLGGVSAGLLEILGAQPGTSWTVRMTGDAELDYESLAALDFTSGVTNLSGVQGSAVATEVTVTDVDEVVTNPVDFGNLTGVEPDTLVTSSVWVVAGLDPGVTVPLSFDREFRVNATWYDAGDEVEIGNDDEVEIRQSSSEAFLTGVAATGYAGVVALSWVVTTKADPAGLAPVYQPWVTTPASLGARDLAIDLKEGPNFLWLASKDRSIASAAADGYVVSNLYRVFNAGAELGIWYVHATEDVDDLPLTVTTESGVIASVGCCAISIPDANPVPADDGVASPAFVASPMAIGDLMERPDDGLILAAGCNLGNKTISWPEMTLAEATSFGTWSWSTAFAVEDITPSFGWAGGTADGTFGLAVAIAKV